MVGVERGRIHEAVAKGKVENPSTTHIQVLAKVKQEMRSSEGVLEHQQPFPSPNPEKSVHLGNKC
jgi:hypothetical protein